MLLLRNGRENSTEIGIKFDKADPQMDEITPELLHRFMQLTAQLQTIGRIWPKIRLSEDGIPYGPETTSIRTILLGTKIKEIDRLILRRELAPPVTRTEARLILSAFNRALPQTRQPESVGERNPEHGPEG